MEEIIIKLSDDSINALMEKYGSMATVQGKISLKVYEEANSFIANKKNEVNSWFHGLTLAKKREIREANNVLEEQK